MQIDCKTETKQSTQILLIVQRYSTRRRKHASEPYRLSCGSLTLRRPSSESRTNK